MGKNGHNSTMANKTPQKNMMCISWEWIWTTCCVSVLMSDGNIFCFFLRKTQLDWLIHQYVHKFGFTLSCRLLPPSMTPRSPRNHRHGFRRALCLASTRSRPGTLHPTLRNMPGEWLVVEWGMAPWWPLLELLNWYSNIYSRHKGAIKPSLSPSIVINPILLTSKTKSLQLILRVPDLQISFSDLIRMQIYQDSNIPTHCGLVTPYGNRDLDQHWLWQVMVCCLTAPSHYLNQCWHHQEGPVAFIWWHYHKIWRYQSVKQDWKLHFCNRIQISQGSMS